MTATTSLLAIPGRACPVDEYRGGASALTAIRDRTFTSGHDLATFIGRHYGWLSSLATHHGPRADGVPWWILNDLLQILRDTATGGEWSYRRLVPGEPAVVDGGDMADLVGVALEAAGLVVLPVEAIQ